MDRTRGSHWLAPSECRDGPYKVCVSHRFLSNPHLAFARLAWRTCYFVHTLPAVLSAYVLSFSAWRPSPRHGTLMLPPLNGLAPIAAEHGSDTRSSTSGVPLRATVGVITFLAAELRTAISSSRPPIPFSYFLFFRVSPRRSCTLMLHVICVFSPRTVKRHTISTILRNGAVHSLLRVQYQCMYYTGFTVK